MVFLVAVGAFAQTSTTGSIEGKATQGGAALPGVTLELRSAALQGVRTDVTDAGGNFRFTLLPSGTYSLTATLSGFNTVKQSVPVQLNKTITLDLVMSPAAGETIVINSSAPVVDVTSAQSGANLTSQTLQSLPLARNFTAAAQIAPGVASDATGATVYGSSGAENEYIIDGLNITGIATGTNQKTINMEFIQEENVLTGGLPAEYGRMTGGAIVAVTKSGSNEFHGDVFGYKAGGSLLSNPKFAHELPTTSTTIGDIDKQDDYGGNLGGYLLKDRLWFFGGIDSVKQTNESIRINVPLSVPGFSLPVGGKIPTSLKRNLFDAKLSLALTPSHLVNVSVIGDPSKTDGAQFAIAGAPSTFEGTNKTGGNDYNALYTGVFGTRWNVNANVGRHKEQNILTGPGTTTSQFTDQTQVPIVNTGGFRAFDNSNYSRDIEKLDISSFFGNHTIKFGGDSERVKTVDNRFYGGGDWVRKLCTVALVSNTCPANGLVYYRHEVFLNDQAPGFSTSSPASWLTAIANPLVVVPKTQNQGLYLQDSWKAMSNLTVNAGIRYETQKVGDRFGAWQINLKDNWAPRIGAIWDPANNGRTKAYVNFGRFYESIPMDINIREFGGEISLDVNNLDPAGGHLTPNSAAPSFSATKLPYRILGGGTVPVDPNLKGQYVDEYLLGYDYEVASNLAVGIKGTYRNLGRVIEDMLVPAQADYFVANPGQGLGANGGLLSDGSEVPVPKPTRKYTGVELHAQKRLSNNYQFFTSYVWSRLQGNYDGTFQVSTGQLDPNINSAYDYADFEINNSSSSALLSNDRTHMFKFYGSYTIPNGLAHGLELGLSTHYYSGTPLTAQGFAQSYRNWEYYLTKRGALGRGPADYEADLHAGYPIALGGGHLNLILDVFNALNRQGKTALDQRYNLNTDPACAGIPATLCNGDGGLVNIPGGVQPAGSIPNPKATATNPSFLTAGTSFTSPRSIRLGARFTF
ncbi:MAG TPA: TonB-dependent receptor [Thermoanaerobaculia bacterium]|nr:TonB-dependent receptor [Thermoanaerobaculia bacterium]